MKILIVRVSSMGDVVHNMPMLADIMHHYPDARIDWVVEEAYAGLVRLNRHVRNIIPFALRRWRSSLSSAKTRTEVAQFARVLRQEAYDFVFDTQGLLKTGVVMGMARLASGGVKVGLANATEGSGYEAVSRIFHTRSIAVSPRTHAVTRGRLVAAASLNYAADSAADFCLAAPDLTPDWLPAHPYAVFFHGTAREEKKWPRQNWLQIGAALDLLGLPVLLPWGSAAEKSEALQIKTGMANATVLPQLGMLEAAKLAQCATLAVGVDTGLTHIAAAFNRPTIELYCDSPRWKTQGDWSANIINLGDSGKPPGVNEVATALHALLADGQPGNLSAKLVATPGGFT